MKRRKFFEFCFGFLASIPILNIFLSCGSDSAASTDDTTDDTSADCSSDLAATIGSNHSHSLTVPAADIEIGVETTYDITGTASHSHEVTLTAAHFTSLKSGSSIQVTSTSSGHTHSVTVTCG
jgi:hypothetical protein